MKKLLALGGLILIALVYFITPVYSQSFNFPFNDTMTTDFGPAFADIILEPVNFLPCEGGPIALCYYSGPDTEISGQVLPCELTLDGTAANCKCFEIPYGKYFVDINAILNLDIYNDTIEQCGTDGSGCQTTNSAPVCDTINNGTFAPGNDLISTFSFECVPEEGIGSTNCEDQTLYAGCMTAPCARTSEEGMVNCLCPTFDGPFQIGLNDQSCNLGGDLVWSAAYNPNVTGTTPKPPTGGCIPDAPESLGGCPLLTKDNIPDPPGNIDCGKVCQEYEDCQGADGIEIGFTCDATLCTSACNDQDLVDLACSGLQSCAVTEIIKLEGEVGCSCCASQICGCDANSKTEQAVFDTNKRQRNRGITPQCDINDTLCGENSNNGNSSSSCALAPAGAQKSFPMYILVIGLIALRRFRRREKS
jgi:hypothetical protein